MKIIRWLFWNAVYLFVPRSKSFEAEFLRGMRTTWWGPFRPSVYHNDDGKQWEVCLSNEPSYSARIELPVWADIDDAGRIVGFTVHDEDLAHKELSETQKHPFDRVGGHESGAG